MRRLLPIVFLTAILALIPLICSAETHIMVASDIHYLAPSLYEGSGLFLRALAAGDAKMTQYSPELLQALVEEALHQRPDVLLLTGDLTFNGERRSHEEFAAAMDRLWDAGVPVYVIPGNHDINNPNARAYIGEGYEPTDKVTPAEFRAIWSRCLLPGECPGAMSYAIRLNDEVWIAMADVSVYEESFETYGFYDEEQQAWLRSLLPEAGAAGVTVISATHQSLIPHTTYRANSYSIYNREYMLEDLRAGGVTLNLSGHIHVQHVIEQDGFTDAATGAFCVYDHGYGWVTVGEDGIPRYERHRVCEEHLPDGFREISLGVFGKNTLRQADEQLVPLIIPDPDRSAMVDFALRFNSAYFTGAFDRSDPAWREDPALALWRVYGSHTTMGSYLLRTFDFENAAGND